MNSTASARAFLPRLAVCSWSLQPESPADLVDRLSAVGLNHIQLDLDPFRETPDVWGDAQSLFAKRGIVPVSGMFRTVGEDYTTPETIRLTGGVVPDATWEQNWANARVTARTAKGLGIDQVTFHAGFLPHDPADPEFTKLADRVGKIARLFAADGITLSLETGQETAHDLKLFLEHLDEPNVAVNFDPANMLLYDKGDPIDALSVLGPWVKGVHLKDATVPSTPGEWGVELPVGVGQVDWPAFFGALSDIGYAGWLCFEREAENQRVKDVLDGKVFVEALLGV
jgi:L-ribulose-5-phosphate 3-epimerase